MKAFKMLSPELRSHITPFVELTASRRSKTLPEGNVEKSVELLLDSVGESGSFILDIASDEDLRNSELEAFYDPANGYDKWCSFLESIKGASKRLRPTILLNMEDGDSHAEITKQAQRLIDTFDEVYLRLPISDVSPEDITYVAGLFSTLPKGKINLVLDAGFIGQNKIGTVKAEILKLMQAVKDAGFTSVRITSSSFPKLVTAAGYGQNKERDHFGIDELKLFSELQNDEPEITWLYSDYGTVHPVRYETRGGVWVPRIDVPLDDQIYYYRYRREDGGYKKAAIGAYSDSRFDHTLDCWGMRQIKTAATGTPPGLSPALWISVRINIHLTRRGLALK